MGGGGEFGLFFLERVDTCFTYAYLFQRFHYPKEESSSSDPLQWTMYIALQLLNVTLKTIELI